MNQPKKVTDVFNLARMQEAVVFALFYLWLWQGVGLHLFFHGAGAITNFPSFYTSWDYFLGYTAYPGGLTEYAAAFLSQLFYYSWLGAAVVALQAWGLCLATGYLLETAGLSVVRVVRYVPGLLLLVVYGRYAYHFETTLALLVALGTACLFVAIVRRWPGRTVRVGVFLTLALACYGLAAAAVLVFALVCVLWQWLTTEDRLSGVLCAAAAAVIPYAVGVFGLDVSLPDAYTRLLPFSWRVLYYQARSRYITVIVIMVALVPASLIAGALIRMAMARLRRHRPDHDSRQQRRSREAVRPSRLAAAASAVAGPGRTGRLVRTLVAACVTVAVAVFSLDTREKARFEVDYYAYHRLWPQVLAAASKAPDDHAVVLAVNRALYHTGRLGSEMFQWPQHPDTLLLTRSGSKLVYWQTFDVFLDLGLVNLAENALTEALEGFGDRPMILQRLAMVDMVKADPGSARVYLTALSKTLWHRDWAKARLRELDTDPDLAGNREVQHLRSVSLERDRPTVRLPEEQMLSWLLEKSPRNQMAFEYLQSWLLLTKQLEKFVQPVGRLKDFGYTELPRHYEEAELIYVSASRKRFEVEGLKPSSTLQQRAVKFGEVLTQYYTNKPAALARMQNEYRGTYFYYFFCVQPQKAKGSP